MYFQHQIPIFELMKSKVVTILEEMHELFKDYPATELNYQTPFQCLVAVILSAQSTDVQVNKVTESLFAMIDSPQDVLDMGLEEFNRRISSIGLHNSKAKNIYLASQQLVELAEQYSPDHTEQLDDERSARYLDHAAVYRAYGYLIPDQIDQLQKLP
jgi:endonuclease-3